MALGVSMRSLRRVSFVFTLILSNARAEATTSDSLPIAEVSEADSSLFSGTVVHEVPLEFPSARGSLVPTLAVVANHQITDGILGKGWGLEGLSRIERRSSTFGVPSTSAFDSDATFWVDGELLVADGSDYRREHDDNRIFSKIYDFSYGNGLIAWQAKRDGWTWTWGVKDLSDPDDAWAVESWEETPDCGSPLSPTSGIGRRRTSPTNPTLGKPTGPTLLRTHVIVWLLSQIEDSHGNRIVYHYDGCCLGNQSATSIVEGQFAFEHVLSKITYGNGNTSISFEYEPRRTDLRASAGLGRLRVSGCRLRQILVAVGTPPSTYSGYGFYYEPVRDMTLLHTIYRTTSDHSVSKLLRSMEYDISETAIATTPVALTTDWDGSTSAYHTSLPVMVNFDGNAWPDLVIAELPGHSTTSPHNVAFHNAETSDPWMSGSGALVKDEVLTDLLNEHITYDFLSDGGAFQFLDINRDGATELIVTDGADNTTVFNYDATTGTYKSRADWASLHAAFLQSAQAADIDGNGFIDLIVPPQSSDADVPSGFDRTKTHWVRNSGRSPYLDDSAIEVLAAPLEDPARTDLSDLIRAAKEAGECDTEDTLPADFQVNECFGGAANNTTQGYNAAQARWGDLNGDGIADVAYTLYGCWEKGSCRSGGCKSQADCPNDDTAYSRIFLGDGFGGFHDTGAPAGPPFLECRATYSGLDSTGWSYDVQSQYWEDIGGSPWTSMETSGAVDLDRSGHLGLIHPHINGSFAQIYAAFDLGLPAMFGLSDLFTTNPTDHLPPLSVAETPIPGNALTDLWPPPHFQILADWNGDGFTDILQIFDSAVSSLEGEKSLPFRIDFHSNGRTVARGRLSSIRTAWATSSESNDSGIVRLTYGFSNDPGPASSCHNTAIPYVNEVVKSIEDEHGMRTFWFGSASWDMERNRFLGYGDAFVYYDTGRTSHLKFSTNRSTLGSLLIRAEYRAVSNTASIALAEAIGPDITQEIPLPGAAHLEFFSVFHHYKGSVSLMDFTAPYFNPLLERCDFWVADGSTVDPSTLEEACCSFLNVNVLLFRFVGERYDACGAIPSSTPRQFAELGAPTPPENLTKPDESTLSILPAGAGQKVADYLFLAQTWDYADHQRLTTHQNYRDTALSEDDIRTTYAWDSWDTANAGMQLESTERFDAGGNFLDGTIRSDFADFDQPGAIRQCGTSSCVLPEWTRDWGFEYLRGDIQKATDPEGNVTSYNRNDCGEITRQVDAEGRVTQIHYGTDCREEDRSFEGMTIRVDSRDGYGRVLRRTTNYGGGSPDIPESRWYDDSTLEDSLRKPRSGVVYGDGSSRLLYLDGWGREVRQEEGKAVDPSTTTMPEIEGATKVSEDLGYDKNGNLRYVTRPYDSDDKIAATWTYADEFGRTMVVVAPGDVLPTEATQTTFTVSRSWQQPKLTIDRDPMGKVCETTYDTLHARHACEGVLRSVEQYDVLGNVVSRTDGDGIKVITEYDLFHRPAEQSYATSVSLYDGTVVSPASFFEYDKLDRVTATRDAEGNRTEQDYDRIGRPTEKRFLEHGTGSAVIVEKAAYIDYGPAPDTPRVTTVDVNGNLSTVQLDGGGRTMKVHLPRSPTGKVTDETRTYDNRGRLAGLTDIDSLTTSYFYDEHGRLNQEVGPDPTWVREYTYDAAGDPTGSVDRDGVVTLVQPYWSGKSAASTRSNPGGGTWTLGKWVYRMDGKLAEVFEDGVSTLYTYDSIGRRNGACIGADESGTISPCGILLVWEWSPGDRLNTETRGGTLVTIFKRNAIGWLTEIVHPDLTHERWERDVTGRARRHYDEAGVIAEMDFDGWGREIEERLPGMGPRKFDYTFKVSNPYFGHVERQTVTEPDSGVWITFRDYAGRVVQQRRPDKTGLRNVYEGSRLLEVQEGTLRPMFASLARTIYTYDTNGRLQSRWGPVEESRYAASPTPTSADYVFSYTWTPEGKKDSVTGTNESTQYTWTQGVLTKEELKNVTEKVYSYASDYPRLQEVQTGTAAPYRSQTFDWERGIWISQEVATDGTDTRTNTFSNRDAYGTARALASTLNGTSQVDYSLTTDNRGRVRTNKVSYLGSPFLQITRTYYDNGYTRRIDVDWNSGYKESMVYERGLPGFMLQGIHNSAGFSYASKILRDPLARPIDITLPHQHVDYDYDLRGRVEKEEIRNSVGTSVMKRSYGYDPRGRLQSVRVIRPSGTRLDTFEYQEPGWLTKEHRRAGSAQNQNLTYAYDAAGNRTAKTLADPNGTSTTIMTYAYGNRLTNLDASAAALTWDDKGNVTQDRWGQSIAYDPHGEPSGVQDPAGRTMFSFVRDSFGIPVGISVDGTSKGTSGGESKRVWDTEGGPWPLAGVNASGQPVLWVEAEGILVSRVEEGPHETAVDPKGSLLMFDSTPLGETGSFGDTAASPPLVTERDLYAGLEDLDGSYMSALHRLYDPDLGLFTSNDPVAVAGSDLRFAYVDNNPLMQSDPAGLCPQFSPIGPSSTPHQFLGVTGQSYDSLAAAGYGIDPDSTIYVNLRLAGITPVAGMFVARRDASEVDPEEAAAKAFGKWLERHLPNPFPGPVIVVSLDEDPNAPHETIVVEAPRNDYSSNLVPSDHLSSVYDKIKWYFSSDIRPDTWNSNSPAGRAALWLKRQLNEYGYDVSPGKSGVGAALEAKARSLSVEGTIDSNSGAAAEVKYAGSSVEGTLKNPSELLYTPLQDPQRALEMLKHQVAVKVGSEQGPLAVGIEGSPGEERTGELKTKVAAGWFTLEYDPTTQGVKVKYGPRFKAELDEGNEISGQVYAYQELTLTQPAVSPLTSTIRQLPLINELSNTLNP